MGPLDSSRPEVRERAQSVKLPCLLEGEGPDLHLPNGRWLWGGTVTQFKPMRQTGGETHGSARVLQEGEVIGWEEKRCQRGLHIKKLFLEPGSQKTD